MAATIGCTVEELGRRMTSEEFGLWLAYRDTQPFGPMMAWPALAEILAAIANGQVSRKDKRPWKPEDFIERDRWKPVERVLPGKGPSLAAIKAFFSRMGRKR